MLACHGAPCPAFSMPFGVKQGQAIVGPSGCSGEPRPSYWNRFCFFGAVLWRTAQSGPGFSGEPSIQARGSLENRPIPGHIGPVPDGIQRPARAATRRFGSRTGRIFERDMVQRAANATNLRSGFLKMTAEDSAIAASATTLDPNSRRPVTDPPFFAIGDKPEADPHRSRSDPSRPVRRRPQRPLIGSSRRWRAARRQGDTVLWALPRSAISRGVRVHAPAACAG